MQPDLVDSQRFVGTQAFVRVIFQVLTAVHAAKSVSGVTHGHEVRFGGEPKTITHTRRQDVCL